MGAPSTGRACSLTLAPRMVDLARGRDFVGQVARRAGFGEERVFDVTVASSEAIANAIEHAPVKGQVEVTATIHPDRLEIQVEGPGEFQAPRRLQERSHRGMGLPLMARLADHLALYSGPRGGTLVSLTFYRAEADRDEEPLPPSIRELIEQNELTAAITENAPIGIYVLGADLRYRWANRTYQSFLDEPYRTGDLTGLALTDVIPGARERGLTAELEEVSRTRRPVAGEFYWAEGFQRGATWWRRSIVPLGGEGDEGAADLLVVLSDETDRKGAEQALRESQERYLRLCDNSLAGVFATSLDGRLVAANQALACIFGYQDPEQMLAEASDVGRSLCAAPEDEGRLLGGFGQLDTRRSEEVRIRRRDGSEGWILLTVTTLPDDFGRVRGYEGTAVDISERKRLEEELERREEQARHVIEHAAAPVFEMDLRGPKFVAVNDAMCEQSGYSRDELLEMSPFVLLDEESASRLQDRLSAMEAGERPNLHVEYGCITKDGRKLWVTMDVSFEYEDGVPARAVVVGHDVTERTRVESELRHSEERQAMLLGVSDLLRTLDQPGEMCRQAAGMLGAYLGADRVYFLDLPGTGETCEIQPDWFGEGLSSLAGDCLVSDFSGIFRVLVRGRSFTVKDATTSGRLSERLRGTLKTLSIGALASVPLRKGEGDLWVINAAFSGRHEWTKDEIGLMREVADRTANAVERAKAETALRESEERHRLLAAENERLYRQQLDIAENLQLALLNIPSEIGPVKLGHLYRSATEAARVGGDFYDVFEVKENNIAILIGDVAGHGIQAARTATLVKDVVHAFTHQSLRTHEVLKRTNLLLIEKELPGFVTVFLGILDRETGHLRYSSAGHPEALIRRASGEIEPLGCGYSPLGVYQEASWKPNEVDLKVDDLLVLYTDGVIEARHNGQLFGEKRLERLLKRKRLSPRRLPHLVLDQVLAFAGGNLEDDVAILALSLAEVGGRPSPGYMQESLLQ